MKSKFFVGILLLALAVVGVSSTNCEMTTEVTITSPVETPPLLAHYDDDVRIELRFDARPPQLFLHLNGVDLSDLLVFTEEGAYIDRMIAPERYAQAFVQGKNRIRVYWSATSGTLQTAERLFYFDDRAPFWQVEEIVPGEDRVTLLGHVTDVSGIRSFTVNGAAAEFGGDIDYADPSTYEQFFSVAVPADDADVFHFELIDQAGFTERKTVAREGLTLSGSYLSRVSQSAVDLVLGNVNEFLAQLSDFCRIEEGQSLLGGTVTDPTGATITYDVRLSQFSCGVPALFTRLLDAEENNQMAVGGTIEDLAIDVQIDVTIDDGESTTQESGEIRFEIGRLIDHDGVTLAVIDDTLTPLTQEVTISFEDIVSVSDLTPALETVLSFIFGEDVNFEEIVLDQLETQLSQYTETIVTSLFASLQFDGTVFGGAVPVDLRLVPEAIDIDSVYAAFTYRGGFSASVIDDEIPHYPGSAYVEGTIASPERTRSGAVYSAGFTVAQNFLNQYFYALYLGGYFANISGVYDITQNPDLAEILNLIEEATGQDLPEVLALEGLFRYITPPEVSFGDGETILTLPDLNVQISGVTSNTEIPLFNLLVEGSLPVSMALNDRGEVELVLAGDVELDMTVLPTSQVNIPTAPIEAQLTEILSTAIPVLLDHFRALDIPAIPVDTDLALIDVLTQSGSMSFLFGETVSQ